MCNDGPCGVRTHASLDSGVYLYRIQDLYDLIRQLKTTALDHSAKDPHIPRIKGCHFMYSNQRLSKFWCRKVRLRGGEASLRVHHAPGTTMYQITLDLFRTHL
jgi:hypothetical protein